MSDNGKSGATLGPIAPHSFEAEEAVLGAIMGDGTLLYDVLPFLKPTDFFIVRHAWVYEAMLRIHARREIIDIVTVCDEIRQMGKLEELGGMAYLMGMLVHFPHTTFLSSAESFGRTVQRAAIRRRILAASSQISKLAWNEELEIEAVVNGAEATLAAVTSESDRDTIASMKQIMSEVYDRVALARSAEHIGMPTGFADLDHLIGNIQRGDFVIVAGRPSMGKTAWLLTVALHAVRELKAHVYIASQEMSQLQVGQRFVAIETAITTEKQRKGLLSDQEWSLFTEATGRLSEFTIWVDDIASLTPLQLEAKAKRLHNEHHLDLVMVDYLQLMTSPGKGKDNRTQEVSDISRGLKQLARTLNVPVIAAAQLSREVEKRGDKRPILSDLRESGSLEQDADIVMFLYREDYYNPKTDKINQAELHVAKHRNGPTGMVPLYFRREIPQFQNLKREEPSLPIINRRKHTAVMVDD